MRMVARCRQAGSVRADLPKPVARQTNREKARQTDGPLLLRKTETDQLGGGYEFGQSRYSLLTDCNLPGKLGEVMMFKGRFAGDIAEKLGQG